jgi:hypothetical protein
MPVAPSMISTLASLKQSWLGKIREKVIFLAIRVDAFFQTKAQKLKSLFSNAF